MEIQYSKQGHCVYYARYHLVFSTKYRRKVLVGGVLQYFVELLKKISRYYPEISFAKVNGEADHVHFLVSIPPKISVSQAVNIIKSNTARDLKEKFSFLGKVYWGDDGVWSDGYFVSTVGINENTIKRYIERQGQEDVGQNNCFI
jgi:putative transposase